MPTIIHGDNGVTFPDSTVQGTALTTGAQVIAGQKTFSSAIVASGGVQGTLTLATAQNTTSGTSIDFTGIPSWVKRITVMFNNVSTNGTSQHQLQIGSGSVTTTGYNSSCSTNGATSSNLTSGFWIQGRADAANADKGILTLTLIGSNTWVCTGCVSCSTGVNYDVWSSAGSITLGGVLDRLRITTVNGTDTFDAGSVNIMYEG